MNKLLEYPFEAETIIKKKKSIKRELLEHPSCSMIEKKIAILGGQTTEDIKLILELFLLNYGIKPTFYESEYNQYFEEGMFKNEKLESFSPDIIYICTCLRNISNFPLVSDQSDIVMEKKQNVLDKFSSLWDHISKMYHCPIIQNNFEYPFFRLMGNKDASDIHGRVNFVTMLNCGMYEYAQNHEDFFVCDINYLSSVYGLEKWSDPYYWSMYKYAVAVPAIPYMSYNVANIIKSIYGKNKKVLNLDLDNTIWGGIIGDDGMENIEIGQETPLAQIYSEFQEYIKLQKQIGVLLTVNSKNDETNARRGFERPDSVLREEDFVVFKANWNPKSANLLETASELMLLSESFVFVDDNPAERAIIEEQIPDVAVPRIDEVEHYISMIDKSGFFECTNLSKDDLKRNEMYQENVNRQKMKASYLDYNDYLRSLDMKAEIKPFSPIYMSRIAQLTNKSNQFNLTTRRYTQTAIELARKDSNCITLYGKLKDRFGDNGVVSVIIGRIGNDNVNELHIELWLMSCRVLKRDIEYAMMDELVNIAKSYNVNTIFGYYYPTAKNRMVKNFYDLLGFNKICERADGKSIWKFIIPSIYENKQDVIVVNEEE